MTDKKDVDEMLQEDLDKINALSTALQTVDQENTNKLIVDLTEVLRNAGVISVIEFGVTLSILCEIFAEEVEVTTAEVLAEIVLTLTQSSQIFMTKEKTSLH